MVVRLHLLGPAVTTTHLAGPATLVLLLGGHAMSLNSITLRMIDLAGAPRYSLQPRVNIINININILRARIGLQCPLNARLVHGTSSASL